jgi:ATP phosphoribosyltransferase
MGLADGIVDLVSTGSTLVMNGLRSVGRLLPSQAILVGAPGQADVDPRIDEVVTMLGAVIAGRGRKYLMMNAPTGSLDAIEALLPGLASPSIMPLAHAGMAAVHAVVGADEVWGLLGRLRGAGATGILVVPIEKLVP